MYLYKCESCLYTTDNKQHFDIHIKTSKHIVSEQLYLDKYTQSPISVNLIKNDTSIHQCELCNKIMKTRSGLWKHKQLCEQKYQYDADAYPDATPANINTNTDNLEASSGVITKLTEMFLQFASQISTKQLENQNQVNEQIVTAITELKNTALVIKNIPNANTVNNTLNNIQNNTQNNTQINNNNDIKFSMNMYLNGYCKNAINIDEFFNNIIANLDAKTYERLGRKGYVKGLSEIIIEELKKYKDYERPFHCVDKKRVIMMIKNNNKWMKDVCKVKGKVTSSIIGKGVFDISERNKYNVGQKDLREQEQFGVASCKEKDIEIIRHAIGHYKTKNIVKVISNIAKKTVIDKKGYVQKLKNNRQLNGVNTIEYPTTTTTEFDEYDDIETIGDSDDSDSDISSVASD